MTPLTKMTICTHCYSSDEVPVYHYLLQAQLTSLLDAPPTLDLTVDIYYTKEDRRTSMVLDFFVPLFKGNHRLIRRSLEKPYLFRRAIGRNMTAKDTDSDVVWFTDCDYVFHKPSLVQACYLSLTAFSHIIHPYFVNVQRRHVSGDAFVEDLALKPCCLAPINEDDFFSRQEYKAIGGLQVVNGDYCRKYGYLEGTKWVEPVYDAEHFLSCKCDVPFRKAAAKIHKQSITSLHVATTIDGVYRLRHSRAGRDKGKKDHGKK